MSDDDPGTAGSTFSYAGGPPGSAATAPDDGEHTDGQDAAGSTSGADDAPGADDDETRGLRRSDLIVGVAVLVALVVAGLVFTTLTGDDGASDVTIEGQPTDDFNRPHSPDTVGVASSGDSWDAVAGVWGIDAAQVYLATPDPAGATNFLTLDMGSGDGTVSAVFSRVRLGAGMVFRFESPTDYWSVLPATNYGTWIVQHVVDGEAVVNESLGLAGSPDGTTVSITLDGATLTAQIDDLEPVELDIGVGDASLVGFTASGPGSNEARWDDFYADPAT